MSEPQAPAPIKNDPNAVITLWQSLATDGVITKQADGTGNDVDALIAGIKKDGITRQEIAAATNIFHSMLVNMGKFEQGSDEYKAMGAIVAGADEFLQLAIAERAMLAQVAADTQRKERDDTRRDEVVGRFLPRLQAKLDEYIISDDDATVMLNIIRHSGRMHGGRYTKDVIAGLNSDELNEMVEQIDDAGKADLLARMFAQYLDRDTARHVFNNVNAENFAKLEAGAVKDPAVQATFDQVFSFSE